MATVTATNKAGVPDIEDGTYDFKIIAVEDAEQKADSKFKNDFPRIVVRFRLPTEVDEEGKPLELRDWLTVRQPMGPRSRLYNLFSAVMFGGETIPDGEDLDTDDLIGKVGRLTWGNVTYNGETRKNIVAYMAPSKKRRAVTEEDIDNA